MVLGLLSWLGVDPQSSSNGEDAPIGVPLMWAALAFARRQFGTSDAGAQIRNGANTFGADPGVSSLMVDLGPGGCCWRPRPPPTPPPSPFGGFIPVLVGDGTADHPDAGLLSGNGFSYDASTCTGGRVCHGGRGELTGNGGDGYNGGIGGNGGTGPNAVKGSAGGDGGGGGGAGQAGIGDLANGIGATGGNDSDGRALLNEPSPGGVGGNGAPGGRGDAGRGGDGGMAGLGAGSGGDGGNPGQGGPGSGTGADGEDGTVGAGVVSEDRQLRTLDTRPLLGSHCATAQTVRVIPGSIMMSSLDKGSLDRAIEQRSGAVRVLRAAVAQDR